MALVHFDFDQVKTHSGFENFPETCPYCHKYISPVYWNHRLIETYNERGRLSHRMELFIVCPNKKCNLGFLLQFTNGHPKNQGALNSYNFDKILKGIPSKLNFSKTIQEVSLSFITIYSEAHQAEESDLIQICGVGYRKALEYLIKDYLIQVNPESEDIIKKEFLGKCIQNYIDNEKLKKTAKRAAWLGNDETHYTRKWLDKDLQDLKKLITLTLHWIEMEVLTNELEKDMPEN